MIYTIRHVTRFRYSAPITESALQVRMQPRREGRQHCLSFELTTNPEARILSFQDYLGNTVHSFDIPVHHQELTVTAQSLVSVMPSPPLPAGLDRSAWDELDALAADSDIAEMLVPSSFARPTELLRGFARELRLMRRDDPLSLLHEINHGVHRALIYRPESTRVDSPIDEALQMRRGVCQDYAHIMIALVRGLGIPCRYVSGYLYHRFTENDRRHPDASHAWVEALLPGLDWIGFDPANDVVAGERHVRVAIGRDYADVPPTRGVFKGQAATALAVAVQVVPAGEPLVDDAFLLSTQLPAREGGDAEQPQQQQQLAVRRCACCRRPAMGIRKENEER